MAVVLGLVCVGATLGLMGTALYKMLRNRREAIEAMPDENPEVLYNVPIENLEYEGEATDLD